ncbi:hypothetical protein JHK87_030607 [Glycine soja]|nr:hypothetical protein JHK87_030607 [Glycine soja]
MTLTSSFSSPYQFLWFCHLDTEKNMASGLLSTCQIWHDQLGYQACLEPFFGPYSKENKIHNKREFGIKTSLPFSGGVQAQEENKSSCAFVFHKRKLTLQGKRRDCIPDNQKRSPLLV